MQILWHCFGQQPRLKSLESLPFSRGVERGPRPGDRRDSYERIVAHEPPGDPAPDGPYRRLARAVRAYEIFPPSLVSGVLPRSPLQVGDTYGICYHFLPGWICSSAAGSRTRSTGRPTAYGGRGSPSALSRPPRAGRGDVFRGERPRQRGGAGRPAVVVAAGAVADAARQPVRPPGASAGSHAALDHLERKANCRNGKPVAPSGRSL